MEFFNRKEEVLDLELTQYGKYLLSIGKLNPSYYAFFDDDVIYDTQFQGDPPKSDNTGIAGPTENQKDTQKRIQETPRVKPQHNFVTVDKTSKQINDNSSPMVLVTQIGNNTGGAPQWLLDAIGKMPLLSNSKDQQNYAYPTNFKDEYYGVSLPLGASDYNSVYSPSWQINFMQGELKSSINHSGGDGDKKYGIKKIPQLEVEVTYNTSVGQNKFQDSAKNVTSQVTPGSSLEGVNNEIFPNGNFVKIEEDYILLDIQEINGLMGSGEFELEVFEIEQPNTTNENLKKLFFTNGVSANLYESQEDAVIAGQEETLQDNLVDYYFEVSVDNEIEDVLNYSQVTTNTYLNDLEPCEDDV